jgi:hypothetical protein
LRVRWGDCVFSLFLLGLGAGIPSPSRVVMRMPCFSNDVTCTSGLELHRCMHGLKNSRARNVGGRCGNRAPPAPSRPRTRPRYRSQDHCPQRAPHALQATEEARPPSSSATGAMSPNSFAWRTGEDSRATTGEARRRLPTTSSSSSAWQPGGASATEPPPRRCEDSRCGTRSCASRAHAQARGSRTPGGYPPQGRAHTANGAAPVPRWPSRLLVSGSSILGSSGSTLGRVDAWARAMGLPPRRPTQRRW